LSRPSLETVTTDHLTPQQKAESPFPGLCNNQGWGFGVCVVDQRDSVSSTSGQNGWNGGLGTWWNSDPAEGMIGIVMTQRAFTSPIAPDIILDFWTSAYRATDD
jgi:CubicO group peptidase (beta-lactamase class C family)